MISNIPTEVIDWSILNEIISMDEDDPEFSKMLIRQYIEQVTTTFNDIGNELDTTKDLNKLNSLGHFLKGSSATLGLQRIAWVCERIQNLGKKRSAGLDEGTVKDDQYYLDLIREALKEAKVEFILAKKELHDYYKTDF
ncbi:hypothetical protein TPHA_0O01850 [Tetrapisispora phaffii CBS 4417]|uniref:HPt domain-containing protein n=1 Tax=Tetrapisispora phaffii (strain ATCC 24235 / CBS 4417 / NBRC 1672 / NRRL Y-8282 / UCD 70-5) TaxID=1071381 RepID=G8C1X4_TETPH|nr:hypothetical protein TPHA_0O01850 [Tetrapisispora phaffii CBS 4417]CCE66152.1 hypothetical protein TPHA_0O01850 [Tetrapisispora phaffii CBS 4417]